MDISKVKLRVKKPGPDSAEENSRANKFDSSSSIEEDFDMEEDGGDEDEGVDSSPINLSIKKSSRSSIAQPLQSEVPDKVQRKSTVTSEKEKQPKVKDKVEPEKKVTTRQKKTEKVIENLPENASVKETQTETMTASADTDSKAKRRANRLPTEKITVHNQTEITESEKHQMQKSDQQRLEEQRVEKQKVEKEEEKSRPENQKEHLKSDCNGKENKSLNKPRRTASKKSEKIQEHVEDAQQKLVTPEKLQKEKVKEKAAKRKAVEALDLSKKSLSEAPSKARRLKATAAEQLQLKAASENTKKINDATPHKSSETPPVRQKKTRNASKKATGLQQTVEAAKDKTAPVNSPDAPEGFAQPDDPTPTTNIEPHLAGNSPAQNASTDEAAVPEKTLNKPPEKMEVLPTCSSGEDTPSPAEDRPAPTFLKPTSPPSLVLPGQRSKPADLEDDEGIHSSHEGGSDISDSASEGSDDSGLNGNGAGSGKMANDPETPTDEIPTPTELKSHTCIFCDRTFPLEVDYRRHLNRHLVNVYYMDNTAKGQK